MRRQPVEVVSCIPDPKRRDLNHRLTINSLNDRPEVIGQVCGAILE